MFISRHTLSELTAGLRETRKDIADLKLELTKLDPGELTRLRQTVNNALRSLKRLDESAAGTAAPPQSSAPLTMNQARARARGLL